MRAPSNRKEAVIEEIILNVKYTANKGAQANLFFSPANPQILGLISAITNL